MSELNKERLGKRIAEVRATRGLSQEALAELLHVSRQTISNWERGKTLVDVQSLVLMAEKLDMPLAELLGEEQVKIAKSEASAARRELMVLYVALALCWIPVIALAIIERLNPSPLYLWVWVGLLLVAGVLAWRCHGIEKDLDLRTSREIASYVESGTLPGEKGGHRGSRALEAAGGLALIVLLEVILNIFL